MSKNQSKPTDKQVIFAKAIAKGLNLSPPNFNSLIETKNFIEVNKDAYYRGTSYSQAGVVFDKIQHILEQYNINFDISSIDSSLLSNESIPKIIILWDNDKLVDIRYEEFSKFQMYCIEDCLSKKGMLSFDYISIISFDTYIDGKITYRLLKSEYLADSEQEISKLYKSNINIDELIKFEFIKRSNNTKYNTGFDREWNKKYQEYLATKQWKEIANNLKGIMKKCLCCNSSENLVVHHLSYDNLDFDNIGNEFLSDIAIICGRCHDQIYSNEINLEKYVFPSTQLRLRDSMNLTNIMEIAQFVMNITQK